MTDLSESVNPLSSIAGIFLWGLTLMNSSSVLFSPEADNTHKLRHRRRHRADLPFAIFIIRGSNLTLFACSRSRTALDGCENESKNTLSVLAAIAKHHAPVWFHFAHAPKMRD